VTCDCITTVNVDLAQYNSRLITAFTVKGDGDERPMLRTERIGPGRWRKQNPGLVASYCPFCDTAYR
jgi:hypothetical protein